MTAKTLKALRGSIAHWQRLADGEAKTGETLGKTHCDLCQLFNYRTRKYGERCHGCPVMDSTGKPGCQDTPYTLVDNLLHKLTFDDGMTIEAAQATPEFRAAAARELEFLKSLLLMKTIAFQLTMPNVGYRNGRWSGEKDCYIVHERLKDDTATKVLSKSSYYYNFGDGWGASVLVSAPDAATAKAQRKASKGFCGYEWMVESIIRYGKIHGPTCPAPKVQP